MPDVNILFGLCYKDHKDYEKCKELKDILDTKKHTFVVLKKAKKTYMIASIRYYRKSIVFIVSKYFNAQSRTRRNLESLHADPAKAKIIFNEKFHELIEEELEEENELDDWEKERVKYYIMYISQREDIYTMDKKKAQELEEKFRPKIEDMLNERFERMFDNINLKEFIDWFYDSKTPKIHSKWNEQVYSFSEKKQFDDYEDRRLFSEVLCFVDENNKEKSIFITNDQKFKNFINEFLDEQNHDSQNNVNLLANSINEILTAENRKK